MKQKYPVIEKNNRPYRLRTCNLMFVVMFVVMCVVMLVDMLMYLFVLA
jgi:hypothetical protein